MNQRLPGSSISDLALRKIYYFVVVARRGSYTRAATELYVAQPALSRAIDQLEQQLGVRLFKRGKAGVSLTAAGNYFLGKAEAILSVTESAVDELKTLESKPAGTVRIGAAPAISTVLIPRLVEHCRITFPEVRIQLRSGFNEELNRWVTDGDVDLAIMEATQARHLSHLQIIDLAREQVHAIVSSAWPIAKRKRVRFDELLDLPLVLTGSPHSGVRRMVETAIDGLSASQRENARCSIIADLDTFNAAKALVARGLAYAVYLAIAVQPEIKDGTVTAIPISGMFIPRVIAISHSLPRSSAVQEVIQMITTLAGEMKATGEWPMAP